MYAYDIIIYFCNNDIALIYECLNRALNNLAKALIRLNLQISPEKMQFCIFSKKNHLSIHNFTRNNNLTLSLNVNNLNTEYIRLKSYAKFLGVYFESNLRWSRHIKYTQKKTTHRINILKAISGI